MGNVGSDVDMIKKPDDPANNLLTSSSSDWTNKPFSENSKDDWSRAVVDGIERLCCDGGVRDPDGSRTLIAATRSRARASAEAQADAGAMAEIEAQVTPVLRESPQHAAKAKTKACVRGKETSEVVTFRGSPPPDSHLKWVGQQDASKIPNGGVC
jgi:hypothetical protein